MASASQVATASSLMPLMLLPAPAAAASVHADVDFQGQVHRPDPTHHHPLRVTPCFEERLQTLSWTTPTNATIAGYLVQLLLLEVDTRREQKAPHTQKRLASIPLKQCPQQRSLSQKEATAVIASATLLRFEDFLRQGEGRRFRILPLAWGVTDKHQSGLSSQPATFHRLPPVE